LEDGDEGPDEEYEWGGCDECGEVGCEGLVGRHADCLGEEAGECVGRGGFSCGLRCRSGGGHGTHVHHGCHANEAEIG